MSRFPEEKEYDAEDYLPVLFLFGLAGLMTLIAMIVIYIWD